MAVHVKKQKQLLKNAATETDSEHAGSQAEERRRDKILKAVYLATERFLRMHPSENSIEPLLEKLGQAAEVSRVYISENRHTADGKLVACQRFEWSSDEASRADTPRLQEIVWTSGVFRRWSDILGRNQILSGDTRRLPSAERKLLAPLGIKSIVVAPIFVGKKWWGIIGFDEALFQREWSAVEIEALKTAANIIGAAIQHQRAENALLKSEKQYRLLVENASEGIVITQEGQLKLANLKATEISGYSREELTALPFLEFVHPDDREMVWRHHVKRLSGDEIPEIYHFRIVNRTGDIRWLENNGVVIEWNGKPATLNFMTDITVRESALEALRESEEKYRQLFENESDAVMIFDADSHRFEDANRAALCMFGYTKEAFLSLSFEDVTDDAGEPGRSTNHLGEYQSLFRRSDGSVFAGEMSSGSFFSDNRQKIIGAVRDISGRLEAEAKIHSLTHELIKVQESERHRIARYLHDQIAQDLSSMKIACDTISDDCQSDSTGVRLKLNEFSKMLQLSINTVRNLSYDLRPAAIDQLGLVKTIYKFCDNFSARTDIEVDFFSAGVEDLVLDFDTEINLFRLIQEGLNNINKHAAAGQAAVRLVASSPTIILRIEDNGKGFDVDSRLHRTLREKRMGLSSMEERVGLLGGKMMINSTPGRGTKILIEVPISEKPDERKTAHFNRG